MQETDTTKAVLLSSTASKLKSGSGISIPAGPPRHGHGSERPMKNAVGNAPVSDLLCAAFDELVAKHGVVVSDFRHAFEKRAQLAELVEWGGDLKALSRT